MVSDLENVGIYKQYNSKISKIRVLYKEPENDRMSSYQRKVV